MSFNKGGAVKVNQGEKSQINAFFAQLVISKPYAAEIFSSEKDTRRKAMQVYVKSDRVLKALVVYPSRIRQKKTLDAKKSALASWVLRKFEM